VRPRVLNTALNTNKVHNFQLPDRTSVLNDKNFIMRMLYSDSLYTDILRNYFISCVTAFCLCYLIKLTWWWWWWSTV